MPSPFDVTSPLALRCIRGEAKVVAACFPHPLGLLYLETFWHLRSPQEATHLIRGELRGDGPWRIGDCALTVLGCHNTDPDLAAPCAQWRENLESDAALAQYPPPAQIRDIARRLGADV